MSNLSTMYLTPTLCLATDSGTHSTGYKQHAQTYTQKTHTHTQTDTMDKGTSSSNEFSSCGWWIRAEQEFPRRLNEESRADLRPVFDNTQTNSQTLNSHRGSSSKTL